MVFYRPEFRPGSVKGSSGLQKGQLVKIKASRLCMCRRNGALIRGHGATREAHNHGTTLEFQNLDIESVVALR